MNREKFLATLDGELQPIQDMATRLIQEAGQLGREAKDCCIMISPRNRLGTEVFALTLFFPLPAAKISAYELIHGFSIPSDYRRILQMLNGMSAFGVDLFGIPPSMAEEPPLLDRSGSSPLDLSSANLAWIASFSVERGLFYFGAGPHSYGEDVGYFLDRNSNISAYRKSGKVTGSWSSFRSFLTDELSRAEAKYPQIEARLAASVSRETRKHRKLRKK